MGGNPSKASDQDFLRGLRGRPRKPVKNYRFLLPKSYGNPVPKTCTGIPRRGMNNP
jgi:hypothetical protein